MTAQYSLAQTMANDPQMQIPSRPKISEDFKTISGDNGSLLFLGGHADVVFRGKAVDKILPSLLPQLMGVNTVDQIKQNLSHIPAHIIDNAISLLYMKGIIEEGDTSEVNLTRDIVKKHNHTLKFLSRYVDLTRVTKSRYEALQMMQESHITLLSDSLNAGNLVKSLRGLGIGKITLLTTNTDLLNHKELNHKEFNQENDSSFRLNISIVKFDPLSINEIVNQIDKASLTIALFDHVDTNILLEFNEKLHLKKCQFLFSTITKNNIQLGPTLNSDISSCLNCANISGDLLPDNQDSNFSVDEIGIAIERLSHHVFSILTKFIPVLMLNAVETLDADMLSFNRISVHKQLSCNICNPWFEQGKVSEQSINVATGINATAPISWFYHENTNHQPSEIVPKGHQLHYDAGNKKTVSGAFKTVKNRPVIPLEPLGILPKSFSSSYAEYTDNIHSKKIENRSTLKRVGELLMLCCGQEVAEVTEGWNVGFRITPSAGSMASQTLYLANFNIEGLNKGIYNYNPKGSLEELSSDTTFSQDNIIKTFVGETDTIVGNVVGAIIINEAYTRVTSKYKNTAYRYTTFDAGAMLASIMLISPLMGFDVHHTCNFYDDELSSIIGTGILSEFSAVVCLLVDNNGGHNGE